MNLLAELKRRNVFRAAAFYTASAWLIVQVATQVFPFFNVANWTVRWIVIDAFPLTGSGKIQKFVLRDRYLAGEFCEQRLPTVMGTTP